MALGQSGVLITEDVVREWDSFDEVCTLLRKLANCKKMHPDDFLPMAISFIMEYSAPNAESTIDLWCLAAVAGLDIGGEGEAGEAAAAGGGAAAAAAAAAAGGVTKEDEDMLLAEYVDSDDDEPKSSESVNALLNKMRVDYKEYVSKVAGGAGGAAAAGGNVYHVGFVAAPAHPGVFHPPPVSAAAEVEPMGMAGELPHVNPSVPHQLFGQPRPLGLPQRLRLEDMLVPAPPAPAPEPEPVEDLPVLFHQLLRAMTPSQILLWSYTMNEEDSAALQQLLESHGCLDPALQPAPAANDADDAAVDAAPAGTDEPVVVPESFIPYPPKEFVTQASRAFKKAIKGGAEPQPPFPFYTVPADKAALVALIAAKRAGGNHWGFSTDDYNLKELRRRVITALELDVVIAAKRD